MRWCPALAYKKGKLGGWVAAQYVALGKLAKWFYSDLADVAETNEFIEPNTPQDKWKKDDNVSWFFKGKNNRRR